MRKTYMIVVIVILTVRKGFQLSVYGGSAISVLPGRASRPEPGPARLGLAQLGPSLLYISLKLGLGLHTLQA